MPMFLVTLHADVTVRVHADTAADAERDAHDTIADAVSAHRVNHIIRTVEIINEDNPDTAEHDTDSRR